MTTEEYRSIWNKAIHLCEIEPNEEEAKAFVHKYYNTFSVFQQLSDKELLITFVGLVVYENRFCHYGSTTPAHFCYMELLKRCNELGFERDFIYDIGDWAATYSTNPYIPMGTRRGFGPREYYKFQEEREKRTSTERASKEERIAKLREEGRRKVEAAKIRHMERLSIIDELKEKPIDDCIEIIESSGKPIFYYIELIESWFTSKKLTESTRNKILSLFPNVSTRHNKRLKNKLENLS